LVHRAAERAWGRYGDALLNAGASRIQALPHVLAVLAGFGRTVSEVGAIILVGGNIGGQTGTMTTAIALQTCQGDLPLALGFGTVLVGVSIAELRCFRWLEVRGTPDRMRSAEHRRGLSLRLRILRLRSRNRSTRRNVWVIEIRPFRWTGRIFPCSASGQLVVSAKGVTG